MKCVMNQIPFIINTEDNTIFKEVRKYLPNILEGNEYFSDEIRINDVKTRLIITRKGFDIIPNMLKYDQKDAKNVSDFFNLEGFEINEGERQIEVFAGSLVEIQRTNNLLRTKLFSNSKTQNNDTEYAIISNQHAQTLNTEYQNVIGLSIKNSSFNNLDLLCLKELLYLELDDVKFDQLNLPSNLLTLKVQNSSITEEHLKNISCLKRIRFRVDGRKEINLKDLEHLDSIDVLLEKDAQILFPCNVKFIYHNYNQINVFLQQNITSLKYLDIYEISETKMNLSKLVNLFSFNIGHNGLTNLTVPQSISFYSAYIESVDIRFQLKMRQLNNTNAYVAPLNQGFYPCLWKYSESSIQKNKKSDKQFTPILVKLKKQHQRSEKQQQLVDQMFVFEQQNTAKLLKLKLTNEQKLQKKNNLAKIQNDISIIFQRVRKVE